jgi:hypothetical protein
MSITPTKGGGVFDLSCSTATDFHHAGKGCMPFPTGERRVGALRMLEPAPVGVTLYNAVRRLCCEKGKDEVIYRILAFFATQPSDAH